MKTRRITYCIASFIIASLIGIGIARSQSREININIRIQTFHIRVDLKPRILVVRNEGEYQYLRYFANSAFEPRMQFLGEEVFQSGVKIVDTYKEND